MHDNDIEKRLTDLEIKASYSEDLLETLNQTIFRQQQQIDALIRAMRGLRQQQPEAGTAPGGAPRDELPPHY